MKNTKPETEKSGSARPESGEKGISTPRRTGFLPDGVYFFENRFEFAGSVNPAIITCTAWLIELMELEAGEVFFLEGEKIIRPGALTFGVLYPPFSITRPFYKNVSARLRGFAGTGPLPEKFTRTSFIFEAPRSRSPESESVLEILNSGENFQPVEFNPAASLLSVRAKRLIDENYQFYPSIARVAARLGVTHAHLTRQFKRDFLMTPNDYLRRLRLADVPLKLARGEKLADVSGDVGYNDLSRFYKQFRQTTRTSPGACQAAMRPDRAGSV